MCFLDFTNACDKNNISGIQLADNAPPLSHLFFAYDAILFARDSQAEIYQLVNILNIFTKASGQRVNLSKCGIICGRRMDPSTKAALSHITNIPIWEHPGKYLGVPAEWGDSKIQGLKKKYIIKESKTRVSLVLVFVIHNCMKHTIKDILFYISITSRLCLNRLYIQYGKFQNMLLLDQFWEIP